MRGKAFISYHIDDQKFVDAMVKELHQARIGTLLVNLEFLLGRRDIWDPDELGQQVAQAKRVIVVLSNSYLRSKWHVTEAAAFMAYAASRHLRLLMVVCRGDCEVPGYLPEEHIRFGDWQPGMDLPHAPLQRLLDEFPQEKQMFVGMWYGNDAVELAYEQAIAPLIRELKWQETRIDRIQHSNEVTAMILDAITQADAVLVDLTGERPNCYYEAGFAYGLRKETILTAKKDTRIHFNLQTHNVITWQSSEELHDKLRTRLEALKKDDGGIADPDR